MKRVSDRAAARVHRRNAERHYEAAEKFRQQGIEDARAAAIRSAQQEDALAERLEGTRR